MQDEGTDPTPARPNLAQRIAWQLTPLGRARLALADAGESPDAEQAGARLEAALAGLREPRLAGDPEARALLLHVLAQLARIALRQSRRAAAAARLAELDELHAAVELRLPLHWQLVRLLMASADTETAAGQALLYLPEAGGAAEHVAEILAWSLTAPDPGLPQRLAAVVPAALQSAARVETLRITCLPVHALRDPEQARRLAERMQPALLTGHPAIQLRAHLRQAWLAERAGDHDQMLAAAQAAHALEPDLDEARYWLARALLHQSEGGAAHALLTAPGPVTPEWQRLAAIAALSAEPSLERVVPCLRGLEGSSGVPDEAESALALAALEHALRPIAGEPPERTAAIATLTARAVRAAGPLPWSEYNLAVKELRVDGDWDAAARRLAAGADASPRGFPSGLLHATCELLAGQWDAAARRLQATTTPGEFAADYEAVRTLLSALAHLQPGHTLHDVPDLLRALEGPPAPWLRAMPGLAGLRVMLAAALTADLQADRPDAAQSFPARETVPRCDWAQWLWHRLWTMVAPAVGPPVTAPGDTPWPPHTLWEQAATGAAEAPPSPPGTPWRQLQDMRMRLARLDDDGAATAPREARGTWVPCPWWPAASPLQPLAQLEGRIEYCYLSGRRALRRGLAPQALEWLQRAQDLCAEQTVAGCLVRGRFGAVLDYWQGVTLAHGGRFAEAAGRLRACLRGPKAAEALAQLGLVCIARDNRNEARQYLERIPPPWPPAAHYLLALLEQDKAPVAGAALDAIAPSAGAYAAAAHRLRGRMAEPSDPVTAAEHYRAALAVRPGDALAARGLARVWLAEEYRAVRAGQPLETEPALEAWWAVAGEDTGTSAAACMHTCLQALARKTPLPEQFDGGEGRLAVFRGPAWQRLAARAYLAAGQASRARALLAGAAHGTYAAAICAVLDGAPGVTALCRNAGDAAARAQVTHMIEQLAGARAALPGDATLEFWHDLARAALAPEICEHEVLFAATLADDARPDTQRALAALLRAFAGDDPARAQAVAACRALSDRRALRAVQAMVECLAAYRSADDAEFLDRYREIERQWPALPCDEATLYVAACEARLRAGDVDAITYGYLPEALKTLDRPAVRRVVGLAFARGAAATAESDTRAALGQLEQAVALLDIDEDPNP